MTTRIACKQLLVLLALSITLLVAPPVSADDPGGSGDDPTPNGCVPAAPVSTATPRALTRPDHWFVEPGALAALPPIIAVPAWRNIILAHVSSFLI